MVFVSTTVKDWIPVFADEACANTVLDQLRQTISRHQLCLCAYVLMPSHLHALLGFREIERLSQVMQSFKSLSARRIKLLLPQELSEAFDRSGEFVFWRPRFDDLIIWSEKQFRIKTDYIHNNPVKAGLVKLPTDYSFSSAGDWLMDKEGLIPVDKEWTWQG
jgi:REP element-mobilizing transposase RayT